MHLIENMQLKCQATCSASPRPLPSQPMKHIAVKPGLRLETRTNRSNSPRKASLYSEGRRWTSFPLRPHSSPLESDFSLSPRSRRTPHLRRTAVLNRSADKHRLNAKKPLQASAL
jgi:hypothetical protein